MNSLMMEDTNGLDGMAWNELPEFQMRAPKCRKGLLREEHGAECAEIYLPPRVTQVVSEIGLRAAWSLDLTTVDPVDG